MKYCIVAQPGRTLPLGLKQVVIKQGGVPSVDSSDITSSKVTLEEIQSVIIGYTAYFGTYEVNEREGYVVKTICPHRVHTEISGVVCSDHRQF